MLAVRRFCLVVASVSAIASAAPSFAQTNDVDALNKQIVALYQAGKYADAVPLAQQVLAIREKRLGPDDPAIAMSLYILAALYTKQGRYADAEPPARRSLDIYEKALGPEHPTVAQALNNLAALYADEGRYGDAEPLYKRSLAIREKTAGPDDPGVAGVLNNIASLDDAQGHYAEAEPLYKRALAIEEKTLGPDHPTVATSLNNLAALYAKQARNAEAEPLYQRALAIREKTLGPDHPAVATVVDNLAALYADEGRYAEAEPLYKRALAIREKALGPDHPDLATSLNNLASFYDDQARYDDAEALYQRSLAIREKAFGRDHPNVAISLSNLATLYEEEGRYSEADPLIKRALAIREKALGPDHPDVATALNNLALLYDDEDRFADAEPLYKRALAIEEKTLGPDHPDVATALNNLAALYARQGRSTDAEPLYQRSLAIREKAFGPGHPAVAIALSNLATLYDDEDRLAEAEPLFTRALAIQEKAFGPDHPAVATTADNLALLYRRQGRNADAEALYRRALAIREKALGGAHPDVAEVINNLAELYRREDRFADAEPLYRQALAIVEKALGPQHPAVARSQNNLIGFYIDRGRYADALPLVRQTIVNHGATTWAALPILFGGQAANLLPEDQALGDSLDIEQRSAQTAAAQALNALAVRFAAGDGQLAQLVRQDQDLGAEAERLDKAILTAIAKPPDKRDAAAEQRIRDRSAAVAKARGDLEARLVRDFPDYAALSQPSPLTVKDIQALLADDEALVTVDLGKKSFVWVVSKNAADWKQLDVSADDVAQKVAALRALLDPANLKPFDATLAYELYGKVLGPVDNIIKAKPRLSFVVNGALTSLPPQVLVASDPSGKALNDVDWLVRTHAVTILPSIASLKVLRGNGLVATADKPLIGFADPVFDRTALAQNAQVASNVTAERGLRGKVADVAELALDLEALPESADELRRVAGSVGAADTDVVLGADATETRVKQTQLNRYRILYFATHGLVAGEVAEFAKLNAEPALVLSLPDKPTDFDDGLLTASEVAQLKLNADWVVLSACNTASGEKPGAEALSGLARAFFYAGGRSLLVSHWPVETNSAVKLMTGTFAAISADPKLSHAEALRKAMLAIIEDRGGPYYGDPKFWAPFVVVGEPAKPKN